MHWSIIPLLFLSHYTLADTMEHYMRIMNQIPQMEMKADPEAQAWARSARNVLSINNEAIAETLIQTNELVKTNGRPLFCLPVGTTLNDTQMNDIILKAYRDISSQQSDKNKMSISQVALIGVTKTYPCLPKQSHT